MSLQQYSKEQVLEMSLIEIAYELLVERNEPAVFNDLMEEAALLQGMTKKEIKERIAQFYTDLNVDGRFSSLGENRWGLKTWYPVDQVEEEVVHATKPKKKKAKKAVVAEDDFDDLDEDEDDLLDDADDLDDLAEDDDDDLIVDDLIDDDDDDEEDDDLEDIIEDDDFEIDDKDEDEEEEEDKD